VVGVSNQTFDHPIFRFTTITGNQTTEDPYTNRWNNIGILGRVNYTYADKYLTSFTFRRDGSYLFSEEKRWGNFPSASVAWRISKEKFWVVPAINDLKIRASYGSLGNSEFLRAWMYYAQINPFPRAVFGPNQVEQLGAIVTQLANNDLRWERKNTSNIGLEASFLDNRFTLSMDYFIAKTDECKKAGINDIIIDPGFGFAKNIEQNFRLLKQLSVLKILGKPILAGLSRKATVYKTLETTADKALNGTTVVHTMALINGASILRVHDVKEAAEAIKLYTAYAGA
jgi:hypothetical protein